MADAHKKPSVAFWTTVVIVTVSYPLSLGPACWISSRAGVGASVVSAVYAPLTWTFGHAFGREPVPVVGEALSRYSEIGAAPHWCWLTSWNPAISPVIGITWEWSYTPNFRGGYYNGHGVKTLPTPSAPPADST
jgi:hypothetical protein